MRGAQGDKGFDNYMSRTTWEVSVVWFFRAHSYGYLTDKNGHWVIIAVSIFSVSSDWLLLYNRGMMIHVHYLEYLEQRLELSEKFDKFTISLN